MNAGVHKLSVYFTMLILVVAGYDAFYNMAYFGDKTLDEVNDWMSSSTAKFVNYWLEEGASNSHFFMLDRPKSIEYNNLYERAPYISYPPGSVIPVYLLAKVLHKDQIQVDFVRQYLIFKYFLDTLLACFLFFGVLTFCLKIRQIKKAIFISVVLSLSWMCLPPNLVWLRNVYFSDECIVTVVLLFTWMEICEPYIRSKSLLVKSLYFALRFLVAFAGVLIDYYFLFVIFAAWLIKIVPLFKSQDKKLSSIATESLIYVLPVLGGLSAFFIQILSVPDFMSILKSKLEYRTYYAYSEHWNVMVICKRILRNYGITGILVFVSFFTFVIKSVLSKNKISKDYFPIIRVLLLIWVPPILHILVFQQHTAQHEVSMIKFTLPFIASLSVILWYVFKRYKGTVFFYPLLTVGIIGTLFLMNLSYFNNHYQELKHQADDYELEYLIREHSEYEDVYFSLTDSIGENPPTKLAISNKLIYQINDISDVAKRFPNLDDKANILFVVRKRNNEKNEDIIAKENDIIANSQLYFENEGYGIYFCNKED